MQDLCRIEFGDGQSPDKVVEIARVALPDRLKIADAIEHDRRVQDGCYVRSFFERVGCRQISLVVNDDIVLLKPACAQPRSGLCVENADRRSGCLRCQFLKMVHRLRQRYAGLTVSALVTVLVPFCLRIAQPR